MRATPKGHPLTVELALAPCSEPWAARIDEAKKQWGTVRHVDPNEYVRHPVDATQLGMEGTDWFRASFATRDDPSSLPLVAGRYVIFSHPQPSAIADQVTFDDRGLVWRRRDEVVKGVSFATLLVNRRTRGPRRDTPASLARRAVERAIASDRLDEARRALQQLPGAIARDPHITRAEKALESARVALYRLRIERRAAREDKAAFVAKTDELIRAYGEHRKELAAVLEPFEVNEIEAAIRRLQRERDSAR
jgi:hypothetical protein